MRVMVIPVVIGALGMVLKSLEKGLEELETRGRIKIIQTTAFLRMTKNSEVSPGDLRRLAADK